MKIAIVTGASSGIGRATALNLIQKDYKVYSLSLEDAHDDGVEYIHCDISDKSQVEKSFSEVFEKESTIDLLINNAGFGISGSVEFSKEKDIKRIFDVNFFGAVYATQQIIPIMRKQKFGKIVFISSMGSFLTLPFQTFYTATKNSLNSLSESLRNELKNFNIQVSTFLLGDIKSNFTAARKKNEEGKEFYGDMQDKAIKVMEHDEQFGTTAEVVGKKIANYVDLKKLKPYKIIGAKYKFFNLLNRILPKSLVIKLVGKIYC